MDFSMLDEYGFDYEKGLARCMGDESFYEMVLNLFKKDNSFHRAEEAFAKGDRKALFESVHELKGVCGNLSVTALYKDVCALVETLRGGGTDAAVAEGFARVEASYHRARKGVDLALGDGEAPKAAPFNADT